MDSESSLKKFKYQYPRLMFSMNQVLDLDLIENNKAILCDHCNIRKGNEI